MTKPRQFTIEINNAGQDSLTEATAFEKLKSKADSTTSDVTIDEIAEVVKRIIRDELSQWELPARADTDSHHPINVSGDDPAHDILSELAEIQTHIATTRAEISALKPGNGEESQFSSAKQELQEIVDATAKATNDILSESERIVEISGMLVERLPNDQIEVIGEELMALDNASTQIMLACGFQDLTGQRITKVVNTMIFVEERINKLMELWKIEEGTGSSELVSVRPDDDRPDKDLLNGPQKEGEGISQNDIDAMFA